jgi:hypothetical protein
VTSSECCSSTTTSGRCAREIVVASCQEDRLRSASGQLAARQPDTLPGLALVAGGGGDHDVLVQRRIPDRRAQRILIDPVAALMHDARTH